MSILKPALFICTILCAAIPGFANPSPTPSPSPSASPAVKARPFPFESVIVSIDKEARTFRIGKKTIRQIHVLPETKISKAEGGNAATFEALAPGMEIRGSVRKRSDAELDAVSLNYGPKPVPSPSPSLTPSQQKK